MKLIINHGLRALCLLVYAMALARLSGLAPEGVFERAPLVALALLVLHAAEAVVMFKHVRRYPGSLAASVLLTLLFGLLHWMPLASAHKQAPTR